MNTLSNQGKVPINLVFFPSTLIIKFQPVTLNPPLLTYNL